MLIVFSQLMCFHFSGCETVCVQGAYIKCALTVDVFMGVKQFVFKELMLIVFSLLCMFSGCQTVCVQGGSGQSGQVPTEP